MSPQPQDSPDDELSESDWNRMFHDPEIPEIYFNGFLAFQAPSDVFLLLNRNGNPVARLNFSFTTAKTLAAQLHQVIAQLEKETGQRIMTFDDIIEAGEAASTNTPKADGAPSEHP